jgi:hypothetical protein
MGGYGRLRARQKELMEGCRAAVHQTLECSMKFKITLGYSLIVCILVSCANPAAETYQKGVEGGEKAINKAQDLQQTVDQAKTQVEQQQKEAEGGTQSP